MSARDRWRTLRIRALNWEYWPWRIVYIPLFIQYFWHGLRSGFSFPTVLNRPYMEYGGIIEESKWQMVQPQEDPNWLSKSHVEVSWPPVKLHIAYSKRIERDLPEVASLLEGVQLDTDTLSEFSYLLIEQKQDPDKIAKDWIAANRDRVGEWMSL